MVTTTFFSTVVVVPSTPPSSASGHNSRSSNAAVVGGVAGGISLLVIALILGLFFWSRKRLSDNPPDRVASHAGHTDLTGAEVTPYSYEPEEGFAPSRRSGPNSPTRSMDSSMQQYRDSQVLLGDGGGGGFEAGVATATSGSLYTPSMSDGASTHLTFGHMRSNSRGSSSGHGQGPSTSMALPLRRSMSVKAREAQNQGSVGLAVTPEEGEEPVIQHSDGGRVAVPVVASQSHEIEIPPSYDSIPGNPT
jgi:hypothetical protein